MRFKSSFFVSLGRFEIKLRWMNLKWVLFKMLKKSQQKIIFSFIYSLAHSNTQLAQNIRCNSCCSCCSIGKTVFEGLSSLFVEKFEWTTKLRRQREDKKWKHNSHFECSLLLSMCSNLNTTFLWCESDEVKTEMRARDAAKSDRIVLKIKEHKRSTNRQFVAFEKSAQISAKGWKITMILHSDGQHIFDLKYATHHICICPSSSIHQSFFFHFFQNTFTSLKMTLTKTMSIQIWWRSESEDRDRTAD